MPADLDDLSIDAIATDPAAAVPGEPTEEIVTLSLDAATAATAAAVDGVEAGVVTAADALVDSTTQVDSADADANAVSAEVEPEPLEAAAEPVESAPVVFKLDPAGAAAVELARAAAVEASEQELGDYLGARALGERIVEHTFAVQVPGYTGWHWSVTVARASRSKMVTVDEVLLLPGTDALQAPAWVPWSERVRPGDLGPGDLVPAVENDPRLSPSYVLSDDPAVEDVAFELGVGRVHVMSRLGRIEAAERWHEGETGPDTAMARHAPAHCGTCGFYLPLAGLLAAEFGACANEIANSDGRVVSVEHGCGAHSEVVIEAASLAVPVGEVFDDEQFV